MVMFSGHVPTGSVQQRVLTQCTNIPSLFDTLHSPHVQLQPTVIVW